MDGGLGDSTQDFSLFFDPVEHSDPASCVLSGVASVFLGKFSTKDLDEKLIKVSGSHIPVASVEQNL